MTCLAACAVFGLAATSAWSLTITGFEPTLARPGDSVAIGVDGVVPAGSYEVRIGGVSAQITQTGLNSLTIVVPSSAETATVEVKELPAGSNVQSLFPLRILAPVTVQVAPSAQMQLADYTAATLFSSASFASGEAQLDVLAGKATVVFAAPVSGIPFLLAVVTDPSDMVELSARETAKALVFTAGPVFVEDPTEAEERLAQLDGLAGIDAAEAIIASKLQAGLDFSDEPGLVAALAQALTELHDLLEAAQQQSSSPGSGQIASALRDDTFNGIFDFTESSPRDLETDPDSPSNFGLFDTLDTKREEPSVSDGGTPIRFISFAPKSANGVVRANPLDCLANLYELDPSQFQFGQAEVDAQFDDYQSVYDRAQSHVASGVVQSGPVGRLFIPATPLTDALFKGTTVAGLLTVAKDAVVDAVVPPSSTPTKMAVPLNKPAIYIARIFSGSLFTPQDTLVANLPDGLELKAAMLKENMTQIGIDSLSVLPTEFATQLDVSLSALKNLEKQIAQKQASGQELSSKEIEIFLNELKREWLKKVISDKVDGWLGDVAVNALKLQTGMFSLAGFDERSRALKSGAECSTEECNTLYARQTVETALIVVGDPFAPRITSFEPQRGHRGRVVTIHGSGFSFIPTDNIVEFVSDTTTPARAEVLAATRTQLVVVVPEEAAVGSHAIGLKILVENSQQIRGESDTSLLDAPFDGFDVVGDPMITSVNPSPVGVGAPMTILGANFSDDRMRVSVQINDGGTTILRQGVDKITVRAPSLAGSHTVKVIIEDFLSRVQRESAVFAFDVVAGSGELGATFNVTSTADNVTADDQITLREAMAWASGTPSIHGPTDDEMLWIHFRDPENEGFGQGRADIVQGLSPGDSITIGSELPPVTAYDSVSMAPIGLGIVNIEGSAAASDGLHVVGNFASVAGMNFKNFAGHGVVLDGVVYCRLERVNVEGAGGDGFLLQNGSSYNQLDQVSAIGCGGDGFRLTGSGVAFNDFDMLTHPFGSAGDSVGAANNNDAWGIRVEAGAHDNHIEVAEVAGNALGGIGILDPSCTNNSIGAVDFDAARRFMNVVNNKDGPGIWSVASGTAIHYVRAAGNNGDGILIEGGVSGCVIDAVEIGFNEDRTPNKNQGSGIHLKNVSNSLIGFESDFRFINGPQLPGVLIGGNRDHGIFLENASNIRIKSAWIGLKHPEFGLDPGNPAASLLPDGMNGIYLLNSSGCTIGDNSILLGVCVVGEMDGSGIELSGPGTFGNRIFGTTVGEIRLLVPSGLLPGLGSINKVEEVSDTLLGNQNGIVITDGAWGNIVGERGARTDIVFTDPLTGEDVEIVDAFFSDVIVVNSIAAGIVIESGTDPGASIGTQDVPSGGNVVQNSRIGQTGRSVAAPNEFGIILRGSARANRIGGTDPSEQNRIIANLKAGIHVDGVQVGQANVANRIIGNLIGLNYTPASRTARPDNFLTQPPLGGTGIGVLVTNSANQPIGGANPGEGNFVFTNGTGVYVFNSSGITVSGNNIGTDRASRRDLGNIAAGVVLSGSLDCRIGPDNFLLANGREYTPALPGSAAVAIHAGSGNRVFGNFIGVTPDKAEVSGNYDGIVLDNSPGNTIGGAANAEGNVIVDSTKNGIVIQGAQSAGNSVGSNDVGSVPDNWLGILGRPAGVGECGILLQDGASANSIGRVQVTRAGNRFVFPAENRIYHSGQAGIRVTGGATLGNELLFNSISENTGLGIETVAGGNAQLPPPTVTMLSGETVFGTVDDTVVPDGSRVQVYSDPAEEGLNYEHQGVVKDGAFQVFIGTALAGQIKATVTDLQGNTSEFGGNAALIVAGLKLARVGPPLDRNAAPGATGVVAGVFSVESLDVAMEVHSVTFSSSSDLEAATSVTSLKLYRDADRDGQVSDGDTLLGAAETFDSAGSAEVSLNGALLDGLERQQWILTFDLSAAAPLGATFTASVDQSSDVSATTIAPLDLLAVASGAFPVMADNFILGAPTPPSINAHPAVQTAVIGSDVTFSVTATGAGPLTYQWKRNGVDIDGATSDTLTVSDVQPGGGGSYSVVVSNPFGSTTSAAATLSLDTTPRLINVSCLASAGSGDSTLVIGFYINGVGEKTLLIRGVGARLAQDPFNLPNTVADPQLRVYEGQTLIATNDDWDSALTPDFSRMGAFGLVDGSKDAALKITLTAPGLYTVHLVNDGLVADGIIEVYDFSRDAATRLTNVSCRLNMQANQIVTLGTALIANPTPVLARAIGPGLEPYIIEPPSVLLVDPFLRVFVNQVEVASNDNWDSALDPYADAAGAFPIATGSNDAVARVTPSPGSLTIQATGKGGTGVAIIELWESPEPAP